MTILTLLIYLLLLFLLSFRTIRKLYIKIIEKIINKIIHTSYISGRKLNIKARKNVKIINIIVRIAEFRRNSLFGFSLIKPFSRMIFTSQFLILSSFVN